MLQASDKIRGSSLTAHWRCGIPRRKLALQLHAYWILQIPASKPAVSLICWSWPHQSTLLAVTRQTPKGRYYFEVSGKETKIAG